MVHTINLALRFKPEISQRKKQIQQLLPTPKIQPRVASFPARFSVLEVCQKALA